MSRLASASDFHAQYDAQGVKIAGTGSLYDDYRRYPFFGWRADFIAARWPISVGKVVVFGCGYGYLVDELVQRGYDAWGVEAADYARNKAAEVLPFASANRVVLANIANRQALAAVRTAAGLTGQARFGLGISEDVLPVCTDEAEAVLAINECRRIVSTTAGRFLHIITCSNGNLEDLNNRLPGLLWRSPAQWRAIVNSAGGAADVCLNTEGPGAGTEF
jgi:SAM-dependent methyltransferase